MTFNKRRSNIQRGLENYNGDLLVEVNDIKNRWKEYIEVLYNKDGSTSDLPVEEESKVDKCESRPNFLRAEVSNRRTKDRKGRRDRQYTSGNVKDLRG